MLRAKAFRNLNSCDFFQLIPTFFNKVFKSSFWANIPGKVHIFIISHIYLFP